MNVALFHMFMTFMTFMTFSRVAGSQSNLVCQRAWPAKRDGFTLSRIQKSPLICLLTWILCRLQVNNFRLLFAIVYR